MANLYKCPNLGNCVHADTQRIIRISGSYWTNCPECSSPLIPVSTSHSTSSMIQVALLVCLLVLIGTGVWMNWSKSIDCSPAEIWDSASKTCKKSTLICNPGEALDPTSQSCKVIYSDNQLHAETLLRFHGSNTIGGKLLPALAETFMKQEGYNHVLKLPGPKEDESFIVGEQHGTISQIEIQAHGSRTAFEDLKKGLCDIGMASRPIKLEEREELRPTLGDLKSYASEHVLALDGIAVIVHPSNPVKTLTVGQVADIFGGVYTDWSQLAGRAGPISVYSRDEKSGTWDFFNDAVLKKFGRTLAAKQRFEDSHKLSEAVSNDQSSIGFIGLNYVGANKIIGLADIGIKARKPSLLTIKTEDYILSRRLYLYTSEAPSNPYVLKFIEFALADEGQQIVSSIGLVNLDASPIPGNQFDDPRSQYSSWRKLTAGASELATQFRFKINSSELDTRANRDIGRVAYMLSQQQYRDKRLIVIGHSDKSGSHAMNCQLSTERAKSVQAALEEEGLLIDKLAGLCEEVPIAPSDTPENKEKNRRVEIWLK